MDFLSRLSPLQIANFALIGLTFIIIIIRIARRKPYQPPSQARLNVQIFLVFIMGVFIGVQLVWFLPLFFPWARILIPPWMIPPN